MGALLLYVLVLLVAAYAVCGLTLLFMQPKLLYRPVRDVTLTPADLNLEFEGAAFQSRDGVSLTGWYLPVPNARFTVLFCHGNGGNIMHRLDTLSFFHDLGLSCFVFDYRGYGHSGGKPSEAGTYLDAQAAYDWLTHERHVPPEEIIVFGRSLGGSIAAHLAGRVQAAGLVVESAFTSYPDIGTRFYPYMPVRPFARYRYNTRAYVQEVRCPILVMHSRDDELVPFEFGTRIFEAAHEPKQFVELSGRHNASFLASAETYKQAWTNYLRFLANNQTETPLHQAS